ncbi:MAG TPA: hypothetical protein VKA46_19765 [Gemmataceae bacterium]|nr:hypothetical protein [Gemmataceae bacterium]
MRGIRCVLLAVVLVVTLGACGCKNKNKDTAPETGGNPLRLDQAGGAPAQGVVRRGAQRQEIQGILENLAKYYELYRGENGRPPKSLQEFRAYLASDPNARKLVEAVDKGWLVWVFDPPPNTNQVLAYEKEEFEQFHNRLVLFGGGAVKLMTDAEFQAALKGQ